MKESFKVRSDLEITNLIVGRAEDMNGIKSNSMDMVVHTFILCSVDDHNKALSEFHRVLKPGGVCVFVEHSVAKSGWVRLFHKCVGPIWYTCFDCKFKNMKEILISGCYDSLTLREHSIKKALLFPVNPIFYGFGTKK